MEGDPAAGRVPASHDFDRPLAEAGSGRRHCWVVLPQLRPHARRGAAWRRTEAGAWEARVSYVLGEETGGVVTGWLPATVLRPHETGTTVPQARAS